jgi:hypothetical protein
MSRKIFNIFINLKKIYIFLLLIFKINYNIVSVTQIAIGVDQIIAIGV